MLAQLDPRTGRVLRLTDGVGPDLVEVRRAALPLAAFPEWEAMKAAAVEAARVLAPLGLIGWDIGAGAAGPVVLGLTATPDFAAHQLADRRGMLDAELADFLEARRRLAGAHAEQLKSAWS